MAYVNVNPANAAIEDTPESSRPHQHLAAVWPSWGASRPNWTASIKIKVPLKSLLGFKGAIRNGFHRGTLLGIEDYLELVEYTAGLVGITNAARSMKKPYRFLNCWILVLAIDASGLRGLRLPITITERACDDGPPEHLPFLWILPTIWHA